VYGVFGGEECQFWVLFLRILNPLLVPVPKNPSAHSALPLNEGLPGLIVLGFISLWELLGFIQCINISAYPHCRYICIVEETIRDLFQEGIGILCKIPINTIKISPDS
jgi:hypothetical protein